ncbi:MAG: ATP-dependent DNA helicase, partial [Bacteroidia bacterium]|nr:ATP-dependent DNA helicase [Bacteroidia bacterium]
GLPPTIPFWLGEAPGRTIELSESVSRLRETIDDLLGEVSNIPQLEDESRDDKWKVDSLNWLTKEVRIEENAADQVVMYLATVKAAMGTIPSQNNLIIERFFDGAGDMHVVIHSPFGTRLNRGWGLALRKRFCRKFNFELQAAATDDAIILSLGSTHSFPLEEVFGYLNSKTVRNILIQALLDAPMFEIRWRWNASRALAVLRRRAGKKVPPQIQRMNSEDLIALIFPDQLACFENIAGEREVPDHPLVNQTIKDCLHEAMDIDKLETILDKIKNKQIKLIAKDLREASPLSHEIISARPYAFLDNAPAEERRTNAIQTRRWLDPSEANDLGKLDIEAIKAVRAEAWPSVENPDELHDALVLHSFLTDEEGKNGDGINSWEGYFGLLINENRATKIIINENQALWVAVERLPEFQKLYKNLKLKPNIKIPQRIIDDVDQSQDPWVEVIRGRMEALGPVKVEELANSMNIKISKVEQVLFALENEGFVFRGNYTPNEEKQEWCERRLLARIHRYTLNKLRKEIEPVSAAVFMQFLFQWHNLLPDQQLEGPDSLRSVLQKLEGFEAQAVSWEGDILPSRIKDYDHNWLDAVCLSGSTIWGKFHFNGNNGASNGPIKTTPISLINRSNWKFFQRLQNKERSKSTLELSSNARQVLEILEEKGASFFDDLLERAELLKVNLEEAMSELVSHGLLTSDSYAGLRSFLVPSKYKSGRRNGRAPFKIEEAGRWNLLQPNGQNTYDKKQSLEVIARILLRRYGIVFRKLLTQEVMAPPWRELVSIYRVLEARGEIRGGRFVTGVWGEQFALPEVIPQLRSINKQEKSESYVSLSASDPLNLTGVITPGKRIPSIYSNRILYKNGVPIAVKEGKEIKYLIDLPEDEKWVIQKKLIQRKFSPKLKGYLGKGIM